MRSIVHVLLVFALFFVVPLSTQPAKSADFALLREDMVKRQIIARGVKDERVIQAFRRVPRHLFVPESYRALSYRDHPLPIGEGQTISQPYIVAFMTEALELTPEDKILEIGTGSGYQAAILSELVKEVYTIEIIEKLGTTARKTLDALGYQNIQVKIGDGYKGWPAKAPFDAVIVTCAPDQVPEPLMNQLKEKGRMIIPVGKPGTVQKLVKAVKIEGILETKEVMDVLFVPMVKGRP